MENISPVPFKIPNVNHGFQVVEGLVRAGGGGIEMEFEAKDGFVGIFKSGVRDLKISYRDLESVELKKSWFGTSIILRGKSMKVFEDVPGAEVGSCTLKIKRKDRKDAERLVSRLRVELSEQKLRELDEE